MNEPPKNCPNCHGEMIGLQGGLICCPKCGFAGEPRKDDTQSQFSNAGFWVLFLAPATLALMTGLVARVLPMLAPLFAIVTVVVLLFASVHCGFSLACRSFHSGIGRFLAALGLILGIGLVNLFITTVACSLGIGAL